MRLSALLVLTAICFAATPLSPDRRRLNIDSFEYVWSTVRDKHWDPKLGGVDWQAVHDELRPRIEAAKTMDEARQIVTSMLSRLHQTHFGIIPASAYENLGDKDSEVSKRGETGMELRILSGHAIVTSIEPDSSARDAGVGTGWELLRIDKSDVAELISQLTDVSKQPRMADLLAARALRSRLEGPVDSNVEVEFSDIDDRHISKRLARRAEAGDLTRLGFLPPMAVRFDAEKLTSGIEYIHFNLFLKPDLLVPEFGEAIHACGHCPGVIIDLRGNPGGLGAMAMGMAGYLISKPDQKLGTMYMRALPLRFVIFPRAEVYDGPVAILVDGFTASTSEILAGGLRDLKRARIFGERTAGAALPSQIERLPNGDGFQFAVANYISESGTQLEGNGVDPDVEIPLNRRTLSEGRDAVREAAIKWLLQKEHL